MTPAHPKVDQINGDVAGTLLLAGAGKMGGALLDGWLAEGLDPNRLIVVDPFAPADLLSRFADNGVAINPSQAHAVELLVLAVKPQSLPDAAPGLQGWTGPETLILSVVAGKTVSDLKTAFPTAGALVRAMPNTPAAIRRGITGVHVDGDLSAARRTAIGALLGAVGRVEWLDHERAIDAVTAVSGSGPAYVFYLTECLAAAAEAEGLGADAAARLARATVEGAAALMAAEPTTPPGTLRANVTSPNGTTAAALSVLMKDRRLERAMIEAVAAARRRAEDMSG